MPLIFLGLAFCCGSEARVQEALEQAGDATNSYDQQTVWANKGDYDKTIAEFNEAKRLASRTRSKSPILLVCFFSFGTR